MWKSPKIGSNFINSTWCCVQFLTWWQLIPRWSINNKILTKSPPLSRISATNPLTQFHSFSSRVSQRVRSQQSRAAWEEVLWRGEHIHFPYGTHNTESLHCGQSQLFMLVSCITLCFTASKCMSVFQGIDMQHVTVIIQHNMRVYHITVLTLTL